MSRQTLPGMSSATSNVDVATPLGDSWRVGWVWSQISTLSASVRAVYRHGGDNGRSRRISTIATAHAGGGFWTLSPARRSAFMVLKRALRAAMPRA